MPAENAMQIFTVLDKSNCRKCGEKTCLAFAGAVFTGRKSIQLCPTLSGADKKRLAMPDDTGAEDERDEMVENLLKELSVVDFCEAASRCGGEVKNGWLAIKILGKEFRVSPKGQFSSDIHINPWVVGPLLAYIVHGKGVQPEGRWISYREVKGGRERYGLFQKRCEEDLRKVADSYPDLFHDMVDIFQAREVEKYFDSDVSVVLRPLPNVPVMICYWRPEDELDSTLNLFFDSTVDDNLGNDGIYSLSAGLATMFIKLAERHGCQI